MSKTTKIVAALGIVAGLGVAALPAFTYAVSPVTGDVEVIVDVEPAIAMTITGNNDKGTNLGGTIAVVTPESGVNPSQLGYMELVGGHYVKTTDTTVDGEKTYYAYTEHVQADYNPVANYSPADARNKVIDTYAVPDADPVLGVSSSRGSLLPNSILLGDRSTPDAQNPNNFGSTVTVYTNNTSGYSLTLEDKDDVTDLSHTEGLDYIPTQGSALAAGTKGWNFDVSLMTTDGQTETATSISTNNAIIARSASDSKIIDSLNTKTSGGRKIVVDYNVATSADQANGTYTDTILYTATCN